MIDAKLKLYEEKPIIFNGEMIRAILDGRKTQTRRVVKPQPPVAIPEHMYYHNEAAGHIPMPVKCPFGKPGDRLWVRETFLVCDVAGESFKPRDILPTNAHVYYRADPDPLTEDAQKFNPIPKWRPSIHMPRWASRITLEVKAVRVERVWDMTLENVIAEGVLTGDEPEISDDWAPTPMPVAAKNMAGKEVFSQLWNSINGKRGYPWKDNPYVWVVEFEVTK